MDIRKRKICKKNMHYYKALNEFIIQVVDNVPNYKPLELLEGSIKINPIPIIISFKNKAVYSLNKARIINLKRFIIKDMKMARFKLNNAKDSFSVISNAETLAGLMGILRGLNNLYAKIKEEENENQNIVGELC